MAAAPVNALLPADLVLPPVSSTPPAAAPDEDGALVQAVADAEAAVTAKDYAEALALLETVPRVMAGSSRLSLRALFADSWARMELGDLDGAVSLLTRARALSERPEFTDVDRADALFRLGCCRLAVSAVGNALSLFTFALELADRSGLACDRLRAEILGRRTRCYQRQRDWESARADVERGLELAQALGDEEMTAHIFFQASIVAERERQWLLARFYAEEARRIYERRDDALLTGRVLNNLGGIAFLLGEAEEARAFAGEALAIAERTKDELAQGYALSSLAQIQLRTGEPAEAERGARRALELLAGRADHAGELGSAGLVLGRALLELGRHDEADAAFADAETALAQLSSTSHLAAAWIARGDACSLRGDPEAAADLYKRAAEALQDLHF